MSKRCTSFDARYGIHEDDIKILKTLDPSGDKCLYLDFIYRQFAEGNITPETFDEFSKYLQLFDDNKSHIKEKDINKYNLTSLRELFSVTLNNVEQDDMVIVYDGPYGKLTIPLSYETSCKLGSGTKWCTSSTETSQLFHEYNEKGPLFIWYDNNWNKGRLKKLGNRSKRFQFHFPTLSFMDERDEEIQKNILHYFMRDHPVISLIFKLYEDNIRDMDKLVEYCIKVDRDDSLGYITKYILNNDDMERKYLIRLATTDTDTTLTETDREIITFHLEDTDILPQIAILDDSILKDYIYPNIDLSFRYARLKYNAIGIEEIDRAILSNPKYTYDYIKLLNHIPKPIDSDNIIVRAIVNREKYIDIIELNEADHNAATLYCTDVVRSRCKAIENADMDWRYKDLFMKTKLEYGNENKYSDDIIDPIEYIEYYKKYGRSDVIDRKLVEKEDYTTLALLSLYCYNAPLSYCMAHLDKDIEKKAIIKDVNIWYYMYMYVFYNIGQPANTEYIIRRMIIHGETDELLDDLCNIDNTHRALNSFNELSTNALEFISKNSKWRFSIIMANVALNRSSHKMTDELFNRLSSNSSRSDIEAYQMYWKKFLNGIRIPTFEDTNIFCPIYVNNYKGRIESYEDEAIISLMYLRTRVRL